CFAAASTLVCAGSICHFISVLLSDISVRFRLETGSCMINYMAKLVERATYSGAARRRGRAGRATPEQLAAWKSPAGAFTEALRHQEAVLESTGLDMSEYDVLVTLAKGPPAGMRPTEITGRFFITKSGMTRLLQRLEEKALVERRACPS